VPREDELSMVRVRMIKPTIATRKPMTKKMRQPQALKLSAVMSDENNRAEAEQQPDWNRKSDAGAPEGAEFRPRRLLDNPGRCGAELRAETDILQQPKHDQ